MVSQAAIIYRYFFALLGAGAIVTEMIILIQRGAFNPLHFFSYFTILSNCLAVAMFIWFTRLELAGQAHKHPKAINFKGAVTVYMLMTGIIFAVLLAPVDTVALTAVPWDNAVLHYFMPMAVLIEWLLFPRKPRISVRQSLVWLAFPAVYAAFSLVRGAATGWYPYPFLNVQTHGYAYVLGIVAVLVVGVIIVSQAVRTVPTALRR